MVGFELDKEIKKDAFFLLVTYDIRKILNLHEESNLKPSDYALDALIIEPQRLHHKRILVRSLYDTRPAYC